MLLHVAFSGGVAHPSPCVLYVAWHIHQPTHPLTQTRTDNRHNAAADKARGNDSRLVGAARGRRVKARGVGRGPPAGGKYGQVPFLLRIGMMVHLGGAMRQRRPFARPPLSLPKIREAQVPPYGCMHNILCKGGERGGRVVCCDVIVRAMQPFLK